MNTISYIPSKDELLLEFRPVKRRPTKELGSFKLWWDDEGNICAIDIMPFTKELKEFEKHLNIVKLGGIWKGIKIAGEEISEAREELLRRLEEKS